METGELIPRIPPQNGGEEAGAKHAQHFFRLYNGCDGIYRTLLFARERGRRVHVEKVCSSGIKVTTPEYTDYVWTGDQVVEECCSGDVRFVGRVGWIRRRADGRVEACVVDGDMIQAFGVRLDGRGPASFNLNGNGEVERHGGPPRNIRVARQGDPA